MIKLNIIKKPLFEMANLRTATTGQPFDFWVDEAGSTRKVEHNLPRFKVTANNVDLDIMLLKNKPFIVNNNERVIQKFKYSKQALMFVSDFYLPLMLHWNGDIDTGQLSAIMRLVHKKNLTVAEATDAVLNDNY